LSVSGSGSSNVIITNSLSSNVSLTIHNGLVPPTVTAPTLITVSGATGGTIGATDRTLLFPYTSGTFTTYSFTPTEDLECDILVVGGGGGGGRFGGGGGGGAILFGTNITLNASSSVSIKVGNGGAGSTTLDTGTGVNGVNGVDSSITLSSIEYIAKGGGGGGSRGTSPNNNGNVGNTGGSGGGGASGESGTHLGGASNKLTYSIFQSFGNSGGTGKFGGSIINGSPNYASGGGGGAGSVGANFATTGGFGGTGKDFITYFGTSIGHSGWFGGGGGGNAFNFSGTLGIGFGNGGNGLLGGGGNGAIDGASEISATNGLPNTGGGGGGGKYDGTGNDGGTGGSGIVIIRYRKSITTTSSSIELIRGTAADANRDYKIGNYGGEFKVISSTSGVDTDHIRITSAGAIFNPTGTASWNTGSDRRIKENIEKASYDKCYENINKLELNRFNYIDGFNTVSRDNKQLGFIAQEVYDIFPKAISSHEYYSNTLSIPDLLSIDVSQINYSLYGAVKKLIEINNEKDKRIKTLDYQLKTLEAFLNIAVDTSNITLDTSNIIMDTSNIIIDTSNITLDTSNISLDTSNISIDTSNISLDTSNILLDTSNISIDTSNLAIDTSNILLDTSNISIDTSNIIIDTRDIIIDTSNIIIDTSNISIDT
jgi:hypothetical protein